MKKKYYTLITGASEGLGKALAFEFAEKGHNLVLVALPNQGLIHVAKFISMNFPVSVHFMEMDLSVPDNCRKLHEQVTHTGLHINTLVNNAGMGGNFDFISKPDSFFQLQINLNVLTPTILSRLFIQELRNNAPSHVMNVSSLAGFFYAPRKQVYGATKAYLKSFSISLNKELKNQGIYVSALCPGGMKTRLPLILMSRKMKGMARWSMQEANEVARFAVQAMLKNKELIIPGFWNRVFIMMDRVIPTFIKDKLIKGNFSKTNDLEPLKRFNSAEHEKNYSFNSLQQNISITSPAA